MNDLYFTAKNKKGLQGWKPSLQAYIFAMNSIKRAKHPHFCNKKAIIPIFFVSILWFLYGADEGFLPFLVNENSRQGVAVFNGSREPWVLRLSLRPHQRKKAPQKGCFRALWLCLRIMFYSGRRVSAVSRKRELSAGRRRFQRLVRTLGSSYFPSSAPTEKSTPKRVLSLWVI